MAEELKPHHYWREDRITGRLVVITPDEYEQWGKDNQPSEAYRPAFTRAQLPSQGGEAVEVVARATGGLYVGFDIIRKPEQPVAVITHPADQVADDLTMVKVSRELLERCIFSMASGIGDRASREELRALLAKSEGVRK